MKKLILTVGVGLLLLLAACSNATPRDYRVSIATPMDYSVSNANWKTISATTANNMMEELENFILLDVRTAAEFRERRIEGALLLPYNEIRDRAEAELPDKDTVIFLYCRSGRRTVTAAAALAALGYTTVYNFGGILDWPYATTSG